MAYTPRLQSLRWRLPLSYAGIALLAVLALGATLLGTLRSFYRGQELAYLAGNATVIAGEVAPLLAAGDQARLQSQIAAYAFLTQTRIEVLAEPDQELVADSGEPDDLAPSIAVGSGEEVPADALGSIAGDVTIVVEEEVQLDGGAVASQRTVTSTGRIPARGSLYGFNLGAAAATDGERSDRSVQTAIVDQEGDVLGHVRLSHGPAYGRAILRSVAWGWALAGGVAVLLAAVAGWLISRRLTRPLLALTTVTGRMAAGDLSARADVRRNDEVGELGQSFNRMAQQVENTVLSLRRFTADAAHELNTPLTALQTDLQLLEDADGGLHVSETRERVARAQAQARRLQALTDSMLELSRLEAATPGERRLVDLTALARNTGELYASQAEQAGLDFTMTLPGRVLPVIGDEGQLQRALANLLDNSLKFTPAPGAIDLSLAANGETAVLVVRDSGIGIPAEDVARLFSRFHRGRNTTGYPGSGLGLAIVNEIMARHGGQVTMDSDGNGTTARLTLPCQADGDPNEPHPLTAK